MNQQKRRTGVAIIVGSIGLAGLLMLVWLAGLIVHIGGALGILALLLAMLIGPTGLAIGVVLVLIAGREE